MRSDEARLLDMLIAAHNVREFVTDLKWEQFAQSRLHQSAVIRELQVIGEAARLISEETKTKHLTVPWGQSLGCVIVSFTNIFVSILRLFGTLPTTILIF
jgi:uncharacterized protein with HEPN domain